MHYADNVAVYPDWPNATRFLDTAAAAGRRPSPRWLSRRVRGLRQAEARQYALARRRDRQSVSNHRRGPRLSGVRDDLRNSPPTTEAAASPSRRPDHVRAYVALRELWW
jgi:hypothetical protein